MSRLIYFLMLTLVITISESSLILSPNYRELFCKYRSSNHPAENCVYGSFINVCGHSVCYKGLGEECGGSDAQCNPNLSCECGKCAGCQDGVCELDLCKRRDLHQKKLTNLIGTEYFYRQFQ